MLVLSRKTSQQITIGPDIQVTIVAISRNQVRLGIQAPVGIPILRSELAAVPPTSPPVRRSAGAPRMRDRRD